MASVDAYPYRTSVEVAFHDLDLLGHVNNVVFLTYLETARVKFLCQMLDLAHPAELPVILAEVTATYKAPAFFGEVLTIGVGVSRFGGKSFDMLHSISGGDGRLVLVARTVLVAYDYATRTTVAVPEQLKQRVLEFQAGWQPPM